MNVVYFLYVISLREVLIINHGDTDNQKFLISMSHLPATFHRYELRISRNVGYC